LIDINNTWFSI